MPIRPAPPNASNDDVRRDNDRESAAGFPVVGIGASAGGVEACSELIGALLEDTGMAFVVILHISAESPSFLARIFENVTNLPVEAAAQDLQVQPNHVYTIVPGVEITLAEGRLQLSPRDPDDRRFMPIDRFFDSLASQSNRAGIGKAIGVVLSGLDGDGAKGLERIKEAGGITFAQTQNTARFSDMPNTAAETGMVDFILPPEAIAQQLAALSSSTYLSEKVDWQRVEASEPAETSQSSSPGAGSSNIYGLLRSHAGIDFTRYKQATLERRVRRRMGLYRFTDKADYAAYLQENPEEVSALYRDVLITVTGFFRDSEAYAFMSSAVLPALIRQKGLDSSIRIWVAGCSSGEECYSLAICLLEYLSAQNINLSIQIFGTDASEEMVNKARHGIYTDSQMIGVSFERRQRFFTRAGGCYQISKAVRELCVFARQDLSSDPPFSGIDLVSCRNVMIYFGTALQERVRAIFHYSLNPDGYLWLGGSESVGAVSDLFTAIDSRHKVYSRQATSTRLNFDFVVANAQSALTSQTIGLETTPLNRSYSNIRRQADQIVLGRYAPVGVAIDEDLEILHFRGDTSPYLSVAPGEPSFNLLKMARSELLVELRSAVEEAKDQNVVVRRTGLQVELSDRYISLEVTPVRDPVSQVQNYLVLFEEGELIDTQPAAVDAGLPEMPASPEMTRLESVLSATRRELADTQAYLQAMVEEKEGTNQQLTTANEEILSSNEELQSTNEELQTAKEEIQAANEELKTTNDELQERNRNAQSVNNDLLNLLNNINLPIVILSSGLRIRRFTPVAKTLFNLIPTDIGRPLSDIRIDIDVPDLEQMVLAVIDSLDAQEREVQDSQGRWYQLRIRPYRTAENQIDGAVMALVDVTDIKQTQQELARSRNYAEAIVETVSEPLLVVSEVSNSEGSDSGDLASTDLVVRTANRAFYETFQVSHLVTEGRSLFELGNGQWEMPAVRSYLSTLLDETASPNALELTREFERIGERTMLLKAREIQRSGSERLILLSIEDITERQQAEAARDRAMMQAQHARAEAEAASVSKDQFLSIISHELRSPINAILGWSNMLTKTDEPEPEILRKALPSIHRSAQTQSRIINDLLEVSRIVQGKLSLKPMPVNLTDLLASVVETTQPAAESAEVEMVTDLEGSGDYFLLDADRLHQVFGNALSNAIKFTPAGGRIRVSLAYEAQADGTNRQARVLVEDNGAGIPADFLPYIFERFRQANNANTRERGGLGLGLAIVKSFVEAHGGTVEIDSPGEGEGATLTVLLPLTLVTPGSPASPVPSDDDQTLHDLCLLLIEDNSDNLNMMTTTLSLRGATVLSAESVDRAIEWLSSERPIDAIVSDISLPERDGFDLIRWVRSHPLSRINQLPAVAVTGHVTPANTDSLITAGFNQHLAKPIQIETLVSAILAACR